jgi:hypothetical protein
MAVTYTDNLHLGMQLDKTDYVNWDAITQNWQKLDAAFSGGGAVLSTRLASLIPDTNPESVNFVHESEV